MKFPHRKRGREAIDGIGIVPRCRDVPIHDCRASYPGYGQCGHRLCGSHLLREPTFVVESNGFRWARLVKRLPREAGHRVNRSESRTLAEADRRAVRKRYRSILTQGGRELPEIPPRPKGKRGRIAKSDGRNPHERLVTQGKSVPGFMANPDVSLTNNAGERKTGMAKVRIKVYGCFRTRCHADAWCRIPGDLSSIAALGYNPLVAIQIALPGKAADMIRLHYAQSAPKKG